MKQFDLVVLVNITVQIFTSKIPFSQKKNDSSVIFYVLDGGRPDVPAFLKEQENLNKLIQECWHQEPSRRPISRAVNEKLGNDAPQVYRIVLYSERWVSITLLIYRWLRPQAPELHPEGGSEGSLACAWFPANIHHPSLDCFRETDPRSGWVYLCSFLPCTDVSWCLQLGLIVFVSFGLDCVWIVWDYKSAVRWSRHYAFGFQSWSIYLPTALWIVVLCTVRGSVAVGFSRSPL